MWGIVVVISSVAKTTAFWKENTMRVFDSGMNKPRRVKCWPLARRARLRRVSYSVFSSSQDVAKLLECKKRCFQKQAPSAGSLGGQQGLDGDDNMLVLWSPPFLRVYRAHFLVLFFYLFILCLRRGLSRLSLWLPSQSLWRPGRGGIDRRAEPNGIIL